MSASLNRLKKLGSLAAPQRKTLAFALLVLPAMTVCVRLLGLQKTRVLFGVAQIARPVRPQDCAARPLVREIARLTHVTASYLPFSISCLPLALTQMWLLNRNDLPSELRIGVRRRKVGIEAHAWIEYCGEPLTEPMAVHENFAAFDAGNGSRPPDWR